MRNGGAVHKHIGAPQSIDGGDAQSSTPVTSHWLPDVQLILFPKRIHEFLIDMHAKWCYHVLNRIRKGKCLKGLIGKTGEMPARSRHCNAERIHNVTERSGRRISEEAESGELLILDHRYDPRAMGRGCLYRCLFAFVQRGFLMGISVVE